LLIALLPIIHSIHKKSKCHQSKTGIGNIFITASDKEIKAINLNISSNDQLLTTIQLILAIQIGPLTQSGVIQVNIQAITSQKVFIVKTAILMHSLNVKAILSMNGKEISEISFTDPSHVTKAHIFHSASGETCIFIIVEDLEIS